MHVHGALDIIVPGHTCCNQFKVTIDTCFLIHSLVFTHCSQMVTHGDMQVAV